jgi:hypothetical protein
MTAQRRDHTAAPCRPYAHPVTGHCPARATFRERIITDSHGPRLHWTIPSESQPGVMHDCWSGPGGEEPSCTCTGYRTHGHCGMTDGLPVLIAAIYHERAAHLSGLRLAMLDAEYAAKHDAGTLTATDRIAWGTVGDRINERRGA